MFNELIGILYVSVVFVQTLGTNMSILPDVPSVLNSSLSWTTFMSYTMYTMYTSHIHIGIYIHMYSRCKSTCTREEMTMRSVGYAYRVVRQLYQLDI